MNIFLDLIGSVFIRGSMITVMLTLTVTMNDALYQRTQHANTKEHVRVAAEIINADLAQAGYNITSHAFCYGYPQDVRFHGDLDNSGSAERVQYYGVLDGGSGYWSLYRVVDYGTPLLIGKKFKSIQFQYYNAKGQITSDANQIKAVRVTLVEDVEGVTEGFTKATKDFKIYPSNL